jgi:ABC-type transport system involved in multi-copper enzyme maturation permease subunit
MGVTIARLLRTEAVRIGVVLSGIALWFLLIFAVVRGARSDITAKTNMVGGNIMQGFGIGDLNSPNALIQQMTAVSFNHPIVLALVGALTVSLGARAVQGELLRGTLDLTLAGPVRRTNYLLGYVVVMLASTVALMCVAWASMVGFDRLLDVPGTIEPGAAARACVAGFAVFSTFGALGLLVSVVLGRRGSAIFSSIGILVAMFALTFAERIWDADIVQWIAPISVFHWFDPGATLAGEPLELRDVAIPLIETVAAVGLACWRFERRDL